MSDTSFFVAIMRLKLPPGELAMIIRSPHPPHELAPTVTFAEPQMRQFLAKLGQSTLEIETLIRRANEGPEIEAELGKVPTASVVTSLPLSAYTCVSPAEIKDDQMAMADTDGALDWFLKAEMLEMKGQAAEAVAMYRKGLELDPDSWLAWNSVGIQLAMLSRWDEAMASFERALEIDPKRPEALVNMAGVLVRGVTDYGKAIDCLERAHELGNAEAGEGIGRLRKIEELIKRGESLAEQGDHVEALKCYDMVLEFNSADAKAWFLKGISLVEGFQDYASAELCFVEAHNRGHTEGAKRAADCRAKFRRT